MISLIVPYFGKEVFVQMKRLAITLFLLVFVLSGCTPNLDKQEEIVQENDEKEEKAIVPKYQISESYYRTITPFKPSGARGMVVENLNSRYDSDEMEEGLLRIAQKHLTQRIIFFKKDNILTQKLSPHG